jgi:prepilin-type processing-associated H-X9-DG protein
MVMNKLKTLEIVAIHGSFHGPEIMQRVSNIWSGDHEVVTPNLPLEDVRANRQTYAEVADNESRQFENPIFFGWSMGGLIAIRTALLRIKRGRRVAGLILVNTAMDETINTQRALSVPEKYTPEYKMALDKHEDHAGRTIIHPSDANFLYCDGLSDKDRDMVVNQLRPQYRKNTTPLITTIPDVPIKAFGGLYDRVVPPGHLKSATKRVLGVDADMIEAGHESILTHAEFLGKKTIEFATDISEPRGGISSWKIFSSSTHQATT